MGQWTSRFAQCEAQVIDVHNQLAIAMHAAEEGSRAPTQQLADAPLHRMLDRANDFLSEILTTKPRRGRSQDGTTVHHRAPEQPQKVGGNDGGEAANTSMAEGKAQQACCTYVPRFCKLLAWNRER